MNCIVALIVVGCGGTKPATGFAPILPPIFDRQIVFGQRVGPVSVGMTQSQLVNGVGKPWGITNYSGERYGYTYNELALMLVVDHGIVVQVSPDNGSYATAAGIHVGSGANDIAAIAASAQQRRRNGVVAYCFEDHTLVTIAGCPMPGVTSSEHVCDIAVGGC